MSDSIKVVSKGDTFNTLSGYEGTNVLLEELALLQVRLNAITEGILETVHPNTTVIIRKRIGDIIELLTNRLIYDTETCTVSIISDPNNVRSVLNVLKSPTFNITPGSHVEIIGYRSKKDLEFMDLCPSVLLELQSLNTTSFTVQRLNLEKGTCKLLELSTEVDCSILCNGEIN